MEFSLYCQGICHQLPYEICAKDSTDGKMGCQRELCTNCGKCIDACPFHAVEETLVGYEIMPGGIFGERFGIFPDRVGVDPVAAQLPQQ